MVSQPHFMKALSQISSKTILVVGDVILDQYTYGISKRISPEAPVPVVLVEKRDVRAGGAGNVALNLQALGMKPRIVSRVGDDFEGREVRKLLNEVGVDCRFLVTDMTMKTSVKTRIISGSQQLLRIDDERHDSVASCVEEDLLDDLERIFEDVALVAISDYAKGMLSDRLLRNIIMTAKRKEIPCITDPKGSDFRKYTGSTIIKPNASEAMAVFGGAASTLEEAASLIFNRVEVDVLMVTRSEKGISLYFRNREEELYPVAPKEVRDVTGAGDTVLAVLATCLASKLPLHEAVPLSNIAASCAIERLGCATVTLRDIALRILEESPTGKICGLPIFNAMLRSFEPNTIMVIKLENSKSISHEEIMKLHHLLVHKRQGKMAVTYIDDPSPDERLLEFLASLDRIDLVVHATEDMDERTIESQAAEIEMICLC